MPTFGELWTKYEPWAKGNRKSFAAETNRYRKHLKLALEKLPATELSPFLFEKIKQNVLKAGLSAQTAKHVLVLMRQVLNFASNLGLWQGANAMVSSSDSLPA